MRSDGASQIGPSAGAILVTVDGPFAAEWVHRVRERAGGRPVFTWPNNLGGQLRLCLARAAGPACTLPNLQLIVSLAAGVDHVVSDPPLPDVAVLARGASRPLCA